MCVRNYRILDLTVARDDQQRTIHQTIDDVLSIIVGVRVRGPEPGAAGCCSEWWRCKGTGRRTCMQRPSQSIDHTTTTTPLGANQPTTR